MDWIKDKKNLPIVAGLGVLLLIVAVVAVLFETGVIGGSGAADQSAAAPPPGTTPGVPIPAAPGVPSAVPGGPDPGAPMAAAGVPGAPGTPAGGVVGAATGKLSAGRTPVDVTKGLDPFKVAVSGAGLKKALTPTRVAAANIAPFIMIAKLAPDTKVQNSPTPTTIPQILLTPQESATMRVSGVVQASNGIHAVLETNGQSQTVQPGDTVSGGKVVSIQSDGLMLRGNDGRLVHVPLGSLPTGGGGYSPPGGGFPGGGFPGGGFPPRGNPGGGPMSNTGGFGGATGLNPGI